MPRPTISAHVLPNVNRISATALAQEFGISPSSVQSMIGRGLNETQIRQQIALVLAEKAAGMGSRGRVKGWAARKAERRSETAADAELVTVGTTEPQIAVPKRRIPVIIPSSMGSGRVSTLPTIPPIPEKAAVEFVERSPEMIAESKIEAMTRKEIALANDREITVAVRRKELVPVAEINDWMSKCIVKARDVLMRIGQELGDRLAEEPSPVKCSQMVEAEIRRALKELKEYTAKEVD